MALNGTGEVGVMGTALYVTVDGRQWRIAIRRIDGDAEAAFAEFHAQQVTDADIKALIPNWQGLAWSHHSSPLPGLPRERVGPLTAFFAYT